MESSKQNPENTRFPAAFTFQSDPQGQLITVGEALKHKEDHEPYFCFGCIQIDPQSRVELIPINDNQPFFSRLDPEQEHVMGCPYHNPEKHMYKLAKQLGLPYQEQILEFSSIPLTQPASFLQRPLVERWSFFALEETQQWMEWIREVGLYHPYLSVLKSTSLEVKLAKKKQLPLKNLLLYTLPDDQQLQLMIAKGYVSEVKEDGTDWEIILTPFESDNIQSIHLSCSRFLHTQQAVSQLQKKKIAVLGYATQINQQQLAMEICSFPHQIAVLGEEQAPSFRSSIQVLSNYFYEQLFAKGMEYYPLQICKNSLLTAYFQQRLQKEQPLYQSEQQRLAEELRQYREAREEWKQLISDLNHKKEVLEKQLEDIQAAIKGTSFLLMILGKNRQRKAKRNQLQKDLNQVQDKLAESEMNYNKARRHAKQASQALEELHHEWVFLEKGVITEDTRKKAFEDMIVWEIPSEVEDEYMVVGVDIYYQLPKICVTVSIQYCRKENDYYIPMLKHTEQFSTGSWHNQNIEEMIEECWAQVYRKIELMN